MVDVLAIQDGKENTVRKRKSAKMDVGKVKVFACWESANVFLDSKAWIAQKMLFVEAHPSLARVTVFAGKEVAFASQAMLVRLAIP